MGVCFVCVCVCVWGGGVLFYPGLVTPVKVTTDIRVVSILLLRHMFWSRGEIHDMSHVLKFNRQFIFSCSRMKLPAQLGNIAMCVMKTKRRQSNVSNSISILLFNSPLRHVLDGSSSLLCSVLLLPLEHKSGHLAYIRLRYFISTCL
jgi:hypothetical protein